MKTPVVLVSGCTSCLYRVNYNPFMGMAIDQSFKEVLLWIVDIFMTHVIAACCSRHAKPRWGPPSHPEGGSIFWVSKGAMDAARNHPWTPWRTLTPRLPSRESLNRGSTRCKNEDVWESCLEILIHDWAISEHDYHWAISEPSRDINLSL